MDMDNLGPGPDIDNLDMSGMDFGGEVNAPVKDNDDAPDYETLKKEVDEANPGKESVEGPKVEADEDGGAEEEKPARDEKGRFAEKEVKIPKSRFDEAVGKEREAREAAERRAAELERRLRETAQAQNAQAQVEEIESKVEELETKYQELLLDGNTAEAAKVMKQIRHAERQIATAEAEVKASQMTARAIEADRLELAIAQLEADYPEFNPDSERFDKHLSNYVVTVQREYIAEGLSPSKALVKAANEVAERFLTTKKEEPEQKGLAAAKGGDRQKAAVEKALSAQKAQPASLKDVGFDSDSRGEKAGLPDVTQMSADEFAALPKATQDRLMGNLV